jgi:hypothetical protein
MCTPEWSGENCVVPSTWEARARVCHHTVAGCGFCEGQSTSGAVDDTCDASCEGANAEPNPDNINCERHAVDVRADAVVHPSDTGLWNVSQVLYDANPYTLYATVNEYTVRVTSTQIWVQPSEPSLIHSEVVSHTAFVHVADEERFLQIVSRDVYGNLYEAPSPSGFFATMMPADGAQESAQNVSVANNGLRNGTYVIHVPAIADVYMMRWGMIGFGPHQQSAPEITVVPDAASVPLCTVVSATGSAVAGTSGSIVVQAVDQFGNNRVDDEKTRMQIRFVDDQTNDTLTQVVSQFEGDGIHAADWSLTKTGVYRAYLGSSIIELQHGVNVVVGLTTPHYKATVVILPAPPVPTESFAMTSGVSSFVTAQTLANQRESREVGQEVVQRIQLCDRYGNFLEEGGDISRFSINIVPESFVPAVFSSRPDVAPTRYRMVDLGDGSYQLIYTIFPWSPYLIHIQLRPDAVDGELAALVNSPLMIDMEPTKAPGLVDVRFDASFIRLIASFDVPTNMPPDCDLFVGQPEFIALLGAGYRCFWRNRQELVISLGFRSIITTTRAAEYDTSTDYGAWNKRFSVLPLAGLTGDLVNTLITNTSAPIEGPLGEIAPIAVLDAPSVIGLCEPLILTGARSFGGANSLSKPLYFDWVNPQEYSYGPSGLLLPVHLSQLPRDEPSFSLGADDLTPGKTYVFQLVVTNAASFKASEPVTVEVTKASVSLPTVTVNAVGRKVVRSEPLSLLGTATPPNPECASNNATVMVFSWSQQSGPPLGELDEGTRNSDALYIPAYTLDAYETYVFELTAALRDDSSVSGSALLSVYVEAENIVPVIAGGDRMLGTNATVVLDGSMTSDPSAVDDAPLEYTWTCSMTYPRALWDTIGAESGACLDADLQPLVVPAQEIATVEQRLLSATPVGVMHEFTLTVTQQLTTVLRSASTSATIEILYGDPPVVQVFSTAKRKASSQDRLLLLGAVTSSEVAVGGNITVARGIESLEWYVMRGDVALDATTTTTGRYGMNLVMMPNSLVAGMSYRFRLAAQDDAGGIGYAEVDVTVNIGPSGGTFAALPLSGEALTTPFTLYTHSPTFQRWTDDLEDMPLQYRFMRLRNGIEIPLNTLGYAPNLTVQLPHGDPNVTLRAVISDQLFAQTFIETTVQVLAPSLADAAAVDAMVDDYIATSVQDQLSAGDFAAASTMLTTVVEVVNSLGAQNDSRTAVRENILDMARSIAEQVPKTGIFVQQNLALVEGLSERPCEMSRPLQLKAANFVDLVVGSSESIEPAAGGTSGAGALRNLLVSTMNKDALCSEVEADTLAAGRRLEDSGGDEEEVPDPCADCINGECDPLTGECTCATYPCIEGRCLLTYYQRDDDTCNIVEDTCDETGRCAIMSCEPVVPGNPTGVCRPEDPDCVEGRCIPGPGDTLECFPEPCPQTMYGLQFWQDSWRGRCSVSNEAMEVERINNKRDTMCISQVLMKATADLTASMLVGRIPGEEPVELQNEAMRLKAFVAGDVPSGVIALPPDVQMQLPQTVVDVSENITRNSVGPGGAPALPGVGMTAVAWEVNPLAFGKNTGMDSDVMTLEVSLPEVVPTTDPYIITLTRGTPGPVGGAACTDKCAAPNGRCVDTGRRTRRSGVITGCKCGAAFGGDDCSTQFSCRWWDYELEEWRSNGCTVANVTRTEVTCQCTHMTDFALFANPSLPDLDLRNPFDQEILTSFLAKPNYWYMPTIMALSTLLILYLLDRQWTKDKMNRHQAYINQKIKHDARFMAPPPLPPPPPKPQHWISVDPRRPCPVRCYRRLRGATYGHGARWWRSMKQNHVWFALFSAKPEDAISRFQRLLVLLSLVVGYSAIAAMVVGPGQCLPQDPGYPDCPWNDNTDGQTALGALVDINYGQLVGRAVVCAILLLPLDRVFVAIFDRVPPPPGASYSDSPASIAWVLPHQLVGQGGQFTHVENVRKVQAHARGFLFRREQYKKGEALKPPPKLSESAVVDKDALRMYPAPGVKHSKQLLGALSKLKAEVHQVQRMEQTASGSEFGYGSSRAGSPVTMYAGSTPSRGGPSRGPTAASGASTMLSDYATMRLVEEAPPIENAEELVAKARPYPFRYKRPDALRVEDGGDDNGAHAWELQPSLLLPSVRATLGPGLPPAQLAILNASERRAGLHTPASPVSLQASPPPTAGEERPMSAVSSASSYSSYSSETHDEPLMPGQPQPPPGDRPPPPAPLSPSRGGGSLGLSDRVQGGSEESGGSSPDSRRSSSSTGDDSTGFGEEMQQQMSSQPSTPPSPSDHGGSPGRMLVESGSREFKPPPPPPGAAFGGAESAVRTRTYRSTNAFALRVLEDEKAEQDLPKIARVQACFRGNQCRKKLRIERAIANSYGGLTGDGGELEGHYLITHMPSENEVARSKARFATPDIAAAATQGKAGRKHHKQQGGRGKANKYMVGPAGSTKGRKRHGGVEEEALPDELRSRFTDLAAVPARPFRHRKRKVVRKAPMDGIPGKNMRTSDERFPKQYSAIAHASAGCWIALCLMYTTRLGVSFDLPTTVTWAMTLLATVVWQAVVQGPFVVAAAVLSAPTLERARGAWYHLMQYIPFQV